MIRVMLVDDHALVRMGFRMLLGNAQIEVVAELDSGENTCAEYTRTQPDVVVMDLDPKARILALSAHEDTAHPQRVLRAGALGYLTKRSAPDALIDAVTAVARHEAYVDTQTARALAMAQVKGDTSPAERLSEREFSVFIQLARGQSVAQIADTLSLSPSTVGTHLYHVKQKLGAGNQSELTLVALQWGLIQV